MDERYEEAIEAFEKAIDINPDDAYAWYLKGSALNSLGRDEEAVEAYEKAKELDSNLQVPS
ncbi:tetratricopeptide repeat protein [Methanolobus sp. ZRKC3]|uniref:tetratricopeptide repeat protein n=1 Tax=Methanolobus sp. ZRKC3 TaxID=3125786 RepID=UPI003253CC3F